MIIIQMKRNCWKTAADRRKCGTEDKGRLSDGTSIKEDAGMVNIITVRGEALSELKMPYDTVTNNEECGNFILF